MEQCNSWEIEANASTFSSMVTNGFRVCAGGVLKYESSKLAQKPNRNTAVDVSTSVPLAQTRC